MVPYLTPWLITIVFVSNSLFFHHSLHFVITQSTEDIEILNYIQEKLDFGKAREKNFPICYTRFEKYIFNFIII